MEIVAKYKVPIVITSLGARPEIYSAVRGYGGVTLHDVIDNGNAILAAQAAGADFAYIGMPFIATDEARRASDAYKQAIVDCSSDDIVYSNLFSGVQGNYLAPSIAAMGLDPKNLPAGDSKTMNFGGDGTKIKAWKDIWGAGQGIGAIKKVQPVSAYVTLASLLG